MTSLKEIKKKTKGAKSLSCTSKKEAILLHRFLIQLYETLKTRTIDDVEYHITLHEGMSSTVSVSKGIVYDLNEAKILDALPDSITLTPDNLTEHVDNIKTQSGLLYEKQQQKVLSDKLQKTPTHEALFKTKITLDDQISRILFNNKGLIETHLKLSKQTYVITRADDFKISFGAESIPQGHILLSFVDNVEATQCARLFSKEKVAIFEFKSEYEQENAIKAYKNCFGILLTFEQIQKIIPQQAKKLHELLTQYVDANVLNDFKEGFRKDVSVVLTEHIEITKRLIGDLIKKYYPAPEDILLIHLDMMSCRLMCLAASPKISILDFIKPLINKAENSFNETKFIYFIKAFMNYLEGDERQEIIRYLLENKSELMKSLDFSKLDVTHLEPKDRLFFFNTFKEYYQHQEGRVLIPIFDALNVPEDKIKFLEICKKLLDKKAQFELFSHVIKVDSDYIQYAREPYFVSSKEFAISIIPFLGTNILDYADEYLQKDEEFLFALAAKSPKMRVWSLAKEFIADNREKMLIAVKLNPEALTFASANLRKNKGFMIETIPFLGVNVLDYVDEYLLKDEEFLFTVAAIDKGLRVWSYAEECIADNKKNMLRAIELNYEAITFASDALREDKELMAAAFEINPNTYKYAAPKLQTDEDLALLVIKKDASYFTELDSSLKKNKNIAFAAVSRIPKLYNSVDQSLRDDSRWVRRVMKQDVSLFSSLDVSHKKNKKIVSAVLSRDPFSIIHVDESIKYDKDIALIAIEKNPISILFFHKDSVEHLVKNFLSNKYLLDPAFNKSIPKTVANALYNYMQKNGKDAVDRNYLKGLRSEIKKFKIIKNTPDFFKDTIIIQELTNQLAPFEFFLEEYLRRWDELHPNNDSKNRFH